MKILPGQIEFEWDEGNAEKNFVKHDVTNKEAEEVFFGEWSFVLKDEKHSTKEPRYQIYGQTKARRTLSIFFTIRESKIRIISARDSSRKERREYEKKEV